MVVLVPSFRQLFINYDPFDQPYLEEWTKQKSPQTFSDVDIWYSIVESTVSFYFLGVSVTMCPIKCVPSPVMVGISLVGHVVPRH